MSLKKLLTDMFFKKPPSREEKVKKRIINQTTPKNEGYFRGVAEDFNKKHPGFPPEFIQKTWKFNEEQKNEICQFIGYGMRDREIVREMEKRYGLKVTEMNIYWYRHHKKWQELIKKHRDEYLSHCDDIPGFHKKVRLARMEKVIELAEDNNDPKVMIAATEHQRKEIEGGGDTNLTLISNRYYNMSDEELAKKEQELLEAIKRERGGPNGIRRVEVEAGEPGTDQGAKDVQ